MRKSARISIRSIHALFFFCPIKSSKPFDKLLNLFIGNQNFTIELFMPELASSLFGNTVKMLCSQAQASA